MFEPNGNILDYFAKNTFNDLVMKDKLPKEVYKKLKNSILKHDELDQEIANTVAHAMKEWALENNVTHFTHWFQPMTGLTAEKHDSFLEIDKDGEPIQRFSGDKLIQGEPDASSFPSGGMRATFEARGYTMWDPSSPAFIVEGPSGNILCVPTVYISYNGEALDKKTPLLRSMRAINQATKKLLGVMGKNLETVTTTLGPEQEYFLIDKEYYNNRPDLILSGRTLLGAKPPKGQEMEDHYFGSIKERALEFMQLAEKELYKLGIPAKTRHNEVAPHQFEIAPIFAEANIAADRNQLVMEVLKKVANRLELALLLNEKPFAGVNGSGKHLNWSINVNENDNLLDPGHTPQENMEFLVVMVAILNAVYNYSDLLRASIANAGNDHRLGANEAPPAIMSVFLGSTLSKILDNIEKGETNHLTAQKIIDLGISNLPRITQDNTDRNRTSPFAFTGNKFEFRALGSSVSISTPAMVLNAAVADSFNLFADEIESVMKSGKNLNDSCLEVLKKFIPLTKPIRYEGDNYSDSWVKEAEKRGLPNLKNTPQALNAFLTEKNVKMMTGLNILSEPEIRSRFNTKLERYCKTITIEYEVLTDLAKTMVLPAALEFQGRLVQNLMNLSEIGFNSNIIKPQETVLKKLSDEINGLISSIDKLDEVTEKAEKLEDEKEKAAFIVSDVIPVMNKVRLHSDTLETMSPDKDWPLPKYQEILFIM